MLFAHPLNNRIKLTEDEIQQLSYFFISSFTFSFHFIILKSPTYTAGENDL